MAARSSSDGLTSTPSLALSGGTAEMPTTEEGTDADQAGNSAIVLTLPMQHAGGPPAIDDGDILGYIQEFLPLGPIGRAMAVCSLSTNGADSYDADVVANVVRSSLRTSIDCDSIGPDALALFDEAWQEEVIAGQSVGQDYLCEILAKACFPSCDDVFTRHCESGSHHALFTESGWYEMFTTLPKWERPRKALGRLVSLLNSTSKCSYYAKRLGKPLHLLCLRVIEKRDISPVVRQAVVAAGITSHLIKLFLRSRSTNITSYALVLLTISWSQSTDSERDMLVNDGGIDRLLVLLSGDVGELHSWDNVLPIGAIGLLSQVFHICPDCIDENLQEDAIAAVARYLITRGNVPWLWVQCTHTDCALGLLVIIFHNCPRCRDRILGTNVLSYVADSVVTMTNLLKGTALVMSPDIRTDSLRMIHSTLKMIQYLCCFSPPHTSRYPFTSPAINCLVVLINDREAPSDVVIEAVSIVTSLCFLHSKADPLFAPALIAADVPDRLIELLQSTEYDPCRAMHCLESLYEGRKYEEHVLSHCSFLQAVKALLETSQGEIVTCSVLHSIVRMLKALPSLPPIGALREYSDILIASDNFKDDGDVLHQILNASKGELAERRETKGVEEAVATLHV